METLLCILAIIIAAAVFGIILNPFFWQGFRNSKFWDEQRRTRNNIKSKNLIDPDEFSDLQY